MADGLQGDYKEKKSKHAKKMAKIAGANKTDKSKPEVSGEGKPNQKKGQEMKG